MRQRLAFLAFFGASLAQGQQIYDYLPETIDSGGRYVIYSHGLIAEGDDPTPTHPDFGIYEFPQIKAALFRNGGFNLVAHHRSKNTEIGPYVRLLESWVRELIDQGVAPTRITLVGFSRGGHLTAYASSRLSSLGINTALLASCIDGGIEGGPPISLGGHLLSIYEVTDTAGSCERLLARSPALQSFEEIAISTGRGHGAFYTPLEEWLAPLKAWIDETNR